MPGVHPGRGIDHHIINIRIEASHLRANSTGKQRQLSSGAAPVDGVQGRGRDQHITQVIQPDGQDALRLRPRASIILHPIPPRVARQNAVNHAAGAQVSRQWQDHDTPANLAHGLLLRQDLVGIVAAFDMNMRTQEANQFGGRVIVKE